MITMNNVNYQVRSYRALAVGIVSALVIGSSARSSGVNHRAIVRNPREVVGALVVRVGTASGGV
jgi:hypothetical protein